MVCTISIAWIDFFTLSLGQCAGDALIPHHPHFLPSMCMSCSVHIFCFVLFHMVLDLARSYMLPPSNVMLEHGLNFHSCTDNTRSTSNLLQQISLLIQHSLLQWHQVLKAWSWVVHVLWVWLTRFEVCINENVLLNDLNYTRRKDLNQINLKALFKFICINILYNKCKYIHIFFNIT